MSFGGSSYGLLARIGHGQPDSNSPIKMKSLRALAAWRHDTKEIKNENEK